MEKWRRIWRHGLASQLTSRGLLALRAALIRDDPRLVQGRITSPPPLEALGDRAAQGACSIGFCGWQANGLKTVREIEQFFNGICERADAIFGEPAACRYFLNWFDETPRAEMRRQLLAEVELALRRNANVAA